MQLVFGSFTSTRVHFVSCVRQHIIVAYTRHTELLNVYYQSSTLYITHRVLCLFNVYFNKQTLLYSNAMLN